MLKEKFKFFENWYAKKLSFLNLDPNHITLGSILMAVLAAYFIFKKEEIALLFVFCAFFFDFLDGAIARERKKTSPFGAYLDGISDRIVEFFILSPFLFVEESKIAAIIILFFGTFLHSFSKAYSDHRKVLNPKTAAKLKSFFGRVERAILIILSTILFLLKNPVYVYLMWIGAFLSVLAFMYLQLQILKFSNRR
ncbi:MAG: CDP-alcohol phosphatidyltransferase family protein [Candidatus Anstonellaceae archaeon]